MGRDKRIEGHKDQGETERQVVVGHGTRNDPYSITQSEDNEQEVENVSKKNIVAGYKKMRSKAVRKEEEIINKKLQDAGFRPEELTDQEKQEFMTALQISCETSEKVGQFHYSPKTVGLRSAEKPRQLEDGDAQQSGPEHSQSPTAKRLKHQRSTSSQSSQSAKTTKLFHLSFTSSEEEEVVVTQRSRKGEGTTQKKSKRKLRRKSSQMFGNQVKGDVPGGNLSRKNISSNIVPLAKSRKRGVVRCQPDGADPVSSSKSASTASDHEITQDTPRSTSKVKGQQKVPAGKEPNKGDVKKCKVNLDENDAGDKSTSSGKTTYVEIDINESDEDGDETQDVSVEFPAYKPSLHRQNSEEFPPASLDPFSGISASPDIFENSQPLSQTSRSDKFSLPAREAKVEGGPVKELLSTPGRCLDTVDSGADSDNEEPLLPSMDSTWKQSVDMQGFDVFDLSYRLKLAKSCGSRMGKDDQEMTPQRSDEIQERDKKDSQRSGSQSQTSHHRRLINKRKQKLKITDDKPYFRPVGISQEDYTYRIIKWFEEYRVLLRVRQARILTRVPWGKPVLAGPHAKNTIDLKRQGRPSLVQDFEVLNSTNDSQDISSQNSKRKHVSRTCNSLRVTRHGGSTVSRQKEAKSDSEDEFMFVRSKRTKAKSPSSVTKRVDQRGTCDQRIDEGDWMAVNNLGVEESDVRQSSQEQRPSRPVCQTEVTSEPGSHTKVTRHNPKKRKLSEESASKSMKLRDMTEVENAGNCDEEVALLSETTKKQDSWPIELESTTDEEGSDEEGEDEEAGSKLCFKSVKDRKPTPGVRRAREPEEDFLCKESPLSCNLRRKPTLVSESPVPSHSSEINAAERSGDEADSVKSSQDRKKTREAAVQKDEPNGSASSTEDEGEGLVVKQAEPEEPVHIECPMCSCGFSPAQIEEHAASCNGLPSKVRGVSNRSWQLLTSGDDPGSPRVPTRQYGRTTPIKHDPFDSLLGPGPNRRPLRRARMEGPSGKVEQSGSQAKRKRGGQVQKTDRKKPKTPLFIKDSEDEEVDTAEKEEIHEDVGTCPLCKEAFPLTRLEAHVDACLDQQEHQQAEEVVGGATRSGRFRLRRQ